MGGLASLAIAAAIFIRPAFIGIDTLLTPFPRGERDSFLRPLRDAVTSFSAIYAAITLVAFCAIALAGAPAFDALLMAMSVVASGGFVPAEGGLSAYAPAVSGALFPSVVTGLVRVVVLAAIMSTVDSLLILASSATVRDLLRRKEVSTNLRFSDPMPHIAHLLALLTKQ